MEAIKNPFRLSFKVLNFYGFYLQKNCKLRWKLFGAFAFCYINVQFMIASLFRLYNLKNFDDFLIAILYVIFSVNLTFKVVCFKLQQSEILEITEDFESLKTDENKEKIIRVEVKISNDIKKLFVLEVTVGTVLGITILALSQTKRFAIPLLYETSHEFGYYAVFAFHYIQVYAIGTLSVAVESIFTISLMLMEAYVESLKDMIADVANSVESFVELQNKLHR